MQAASFKLPATAFALVLLVAGCHFGPVPESAGFRRPWGRGTSGLKLPSPADISAKLTGSKPVESRADPISLSTDAKPSAKLYVATARLSEHAGKVAEAEEQYQKALAVDGRHVEALVGYARLCDRQGRMAEAAALYERAAEAQPKNASILNDLGLCLARQREYREALRALDRAVRLAPKKWLYRNNIAMVLVETGNVDAAVAHLQAVQEEAVAHYNVGYILQKKGDLKRAAEHFGRALEQDPGLEEARIWLAKLGEEPGATADSTPRVAAERRRNAAPQTRPHATAPAGRGQTGPPAGRQLPRVYYGPDRAQAQYSPSVGRPGYTNVAPLPTPTSVDRVPGPAVSGSGYGVAR